jgi:GNAT superfamily N-acetyltransferase
MATRSWWISIGDWGGRGLTPTKRMSIHLRPAMPDDAAAVAELSAELGHPVSSADVPARLALILADGGAVMLAVDGTRPVALMCLARLHSLHASGPVAYITALIITTEWRGRGLGRTLVQEAMRWARERGCERMSVTSAEHRTDAHAFYPRCGLPYTGRRFSVAIGDPRPHAN